MTRFARRLLALCSIAGGGVLAASTPAVADAPAPTTTSPPPTSTPASPTGPGASVQVRSGLAVPSGDTSPVTLPSIEGSVRTGLASGLPAPPPSAPPAPVAPRPPAPTPVPARTPVTTPAPAAPGTDHLQVPPPPPSVAPVAAAPPPPGATHVVAPGDSLWRIAAEVVGAGSGRAPTDLSPSDITPYWQRLCDLNQPRLRSGDVNLIFPGELVELPSP